MGGTSVKSKSQNGQSVTLGGPSPNTPEKLASALCEGDQLPADLMKKLINQVSQTLLKAATAYCKDKKDDPQCQQKAQKTWVFGVRD